MDRTILALLFGVVSSCVFVVDPPDTRCDDVAMRNPDGSVDACDLAACEACDDACGRSCAILESYPPQYACEGDGSWSVYDECPDWQPPGAIPRAVDVTSLGCGVGQGESWVAEPVGGGEIDVTHFDYLEGCCPQAVQIAVAVHEPQTLVVDYQLVDDLCDCICGLDVSYTLVDVPEGTWTLRSAESGLETVIDVSR